MIRALTFSVFTLLMLGATLGCTSIQNSAEAFGSNFLKLIGFTPAAAVTQASQGIAEAMSELNPEEEYYLGRSVAAHILARYPKYNDPHLAEYLNLVGAAVTSFSEQVPTFTGFHFTIVESEAADAISTPGGFIFITTGMLKLIKDEDQLAALLAHEVSHVTLRHGLKSISRDKLTRAIASLGSLAGAIDCSGVLAQASAVFGSAVEEVSVTLLERGYSREFEYEADAAAISTLSRAGYNATALIELLSKIDTAEDGHGWLSTHPESAERIKKIYSHPCLSGEATCPISPLHSAEQIEHYRKVRSQRFSVATHLRAVR